MTDDEPTYMVFVRNWWKENPKFPNGLEPADGEDTVILAEGVSLSVARQMCREYNEENDPGRLSRKAEFTQE